MTRTAHRQAQVGAAAVLLLAASLLTGCQNSAIVSDRSGAGDESIDALREWTTREVDAVTDTLGVDTSWRMLLDTGLTWPADREAIFESSHLPRCTFDPGQQNAASVHVDLITEPLDEPLEGMLTPVRERWEADGWTISEIGSSDYLRADRADGAFVTIEAAEGDAGKFVSLSVTSHCSTNVTVTH